MDGVHAMAAELFVKIMTERQSRGLASEIDAAAAARDSYAYAKAFFEEHGRHLERGANSAGTLAGSVQPLRAGSYR